MHQLSVCRTCPRDNVIKGEVIASLSACVAQLPDGFQMRLVECLGGCPWPYAVALNAPDKWRVRLTGLAPHHAIDLVDAARAYGASSDGYLVDADLPLRLRGHISARSPTRPCRTDAGRTEITAHSIQKDTKP